MKHIFVVVLLTVVFFLSGTSFALDEAQLSDTPTQRSCEQLQNSGFDSEQLAKSGCCSCHSGVYGCSGGGRQECCDGTLSPSCTCHKEDAPEPLVN